jgi:DNA mismatch repair protein MutS
VIADGFHPELDELRAIGRDGRAAIAAIEAREREATGIGSLKVRFNQVFGYYVEVSKSNLHLVPERYQRKQTIAGGERYVTPEIKEYEAKVLNAQERIEALEYEIFVALRTEVAAHAARLKAAARGAALLDVLAAWAETAARLGFVRPRVLEGCVLRIVAGRHPVVESTLGEGSFTPNDTDLDGAGTAIVILTGLNMGGKSTYLRHRARGPARAGGLVRAAEEAEIVVGPDLLPRRRLGQPSPRARAPSWWR